MAEKLYAVLSQDNPPPDIEALKARYGALFDAEQWPEAAEAYGELLAAQARQPQPERKPFSVLLLYPDYAMDGLTTFYTWVEAPTPQQAVLLARHDAITSQEDPEAIVAPEDFALLGVWAGHQRMLLGLCDDV
jgi:hypothetical protein